MRRIAILILGAAAFAAATVEIAAAADGCGRGRYWNGYRCTGQSGYYGGPQYHGRPQYYGRPAPYARSYGPPRPVGSQYCDGRRCYRSAPHSCSVPGYTIQDGVCKPYRGY